MNAVFATLAALELRNQGHGGQLVEVPLVEAGLAIAAEQVLEFSAFGVQLERTANRSAYAVPQGVFDGSDGGQVAVSVSEPRHWQALVAALNVAELRDPVLTQSAARRAREDQLETLLAEYCAKRPAAVVADTLAKAGVPAALLRNVRDLNHHPQLKARGFFQRRDHAVVGELDYPSFPFRFDGAYLPIERPAPLLGEHNREVLQGLLGLTDSEIADLEAQAVIGTRPSFM